MTNTELSENIGSNLLLSVKGLKKKFANPMILNDISFDLHQGEILGIIGPSGGGKTTLLRCIDLLENIHSGCINYFSPFNAYYDQSGLQPLLENQTVLNATVKSPAEENLRRQIGFVFQAFNLWEDRTVLQNLILAPQVVLNLNKKDAEVQAETLLDSFGLGDKRNFRIWQLSGGQRQRIAIIRALMMRPVLMLCDEITSALDPMLAYEVLQAIQKLSDTGMTMVMVTHHIEFAAKLCDRLMFLSEGRIVQMDTPENLLTDPATNQVRDFLRVLRVAG